MNIFLATIFCFLISLGSLCDGRIETHIYDAYVSPAKVEVRAEGSRGIDIQMNLSGFNSRDIQTPIGKFQILSIPQSDWISETGKPKLPVIRKTLSVPPDAELSLEIRSESHIVLDGYRVYPSGRKVVKNSRNGTVYIDEEFAIEETFYKTGGTYPGDIARVSFQGHMRGQKIAQIEFHPLRYIPSTNQLIFHKQINVSLSFRGGAGPSGEVDMKGVLAPSMKYSVQGSVTYPENLLSTYDADYIVIAPEPFYSSAKLRELVDWRSLYSGLDVVVVSADKLYYSFSGRGRDEIIRNFIRYAYHNWRGRHAQDMHISYVLLVGDAELLPTHISENKIFDESIATDNWYACIDENDLLPDVIIGRIPVKSISELNVVINKIIQYEKQPLYGNWANSALLILGTVDLLKDGLINARDNYLLPTGFNVDELSALEGDDAYDVISMLNKGEYIIDYAGHGFVSSWELFSSADITRLHNGRMLPVIFSLACSTGYFDHPSQDSIGEAFVKSENGAIAYFGASRLATISDVGFSLSEAIGLHHIFNLGEIVMFTKLKLLPNSLDLELYNLLGDPALDLSAPRREPGLVELVVTSSDISFEPEVPKQGDQMTIKVNVHNFGSLSAYNVNLEVRDGQFGALIDKRVVQEIPSMSKIAVQIPWSVPLSKPQHDIYVKVYPQNDDERYKGNNGSHKTVVVSLESPNFPRSLQDNVVSAPVGADLDNDGLLEIIVQNNGYDNIGRIYVINSDGQLRPGWHKTVYRQYPGYHNTYYEPNIGPVPSIGDIDGDGASEIVAVFQSRDVYAWKGDGSVVPGWPVRTNGYATTTPVLSDLDSDGKMEVIFATSDGMVNVIKNDLSKLPGWPVYTGVPGHIFVAVADIDNDRSTEIVAYQVRMPQSTSGTSYLYAWTRDGKQIFSTSIYGAGSLVPPVIGDLNGDGYSEIITCPETPEGSKISIYKHDGSIYTSWLLKDDKVRTGLVLCDIDNDGDVEIIVTSVMSNLYAWHHNGQNVYGFPVNISDSYWCSTPVVGDVNGDGSLDIVFTSYGSFVYAYNAKGKLVEGWPVVSNENGTSTPPMIADVDSDGLTDIVFASQGNLHMLSLMVIYHTQNAIEWRMFQHDKMHTGSYNAKAILPQPPMNVRAEDTPNDKGNSITIYWELSPDDSRSKGYLIYRLDDPNGQIKLIGSVPQGRSSFVDKTVRDGVFYWYSVRTTDGIYMSVASTPVSAYSFNNFAPNPPDEIYLNPIKMDNVVDIWWKVGEGVAGYKVYYGESPKSRDKVINVGKSNHYSITGLTNGKEYFFSVTAYDQEGNESLPSKEIVAIPQDDDTEPPTFSAFYPSEVVESVDFHIRCSITDPSGVYDDDTSSDGQGIYLIWAINELSGEVHMVRLSRISENLYQTDSKIPGVQAGTKIVYKVFAWDNDSDWNNANDRTRGVSSVQTVTVSRSPLLVYSYPNPADGRFTGKITFRYYTESDGNATIKIYDVAGKIVEVIESEVTGSGYRESEWDITRIASGIYVYTVELQSSAGKQTVKKKLAIIR